LILTKSVIRQLIYRSYIVCLVSQASGQIKQKRNSEAMLEEVYYGIHNLV
jgi:hypothetical protein